MPHNEEKFLFETRNLVDKLCLSGKKSKNQNIILDQSASYWRPDDYFKYFKNLKIIIVNRDPRSIYYSMKSRNSKAYPSSDVIIFSKWYKSIREKQKKIKNKKIYYIQYENFLENFEKEVKKLNNFLNIKDNIKSTFNLELSRKNVYKARNNLNSKDLNYIKKTLKKYLNW